VYLIGLQRSLYSTPMSHCATVKPNSCATLLWSRVCGLPIFEPLCAHLRLISTTLPPLDSNLRVGIMTVPRVLCAWFVHRWLVFILFEHLANNFTGRTKSAAARITQCLETTTEEELDIRDSCENFERGPLFLNSITFSYFHEYTRSTPRMYGSSS
jgi:hypothetical protein